MFSAISTKGNPHSFNYSHATSVSNSYSTEYSDDSFDDDESFVGLRENKLAKIFLTNEQSPIPKCVTLWRMDEVELKILPEALEIIANHVRNQGASKYKTGLLIGGF